MKINSVKIISLLFFVLSAFYLYTAHQIQVFAFDEGAPFNAKTFPIYLGYAGMFFSGLKIVLPDQKPIEVDPNDENIIRRENLKKYNHVFKSNNSSIEDLEKIPAYKRMGIEINNSKSEGDEIFSKTILNEENKLEFPDVNTYLHDNVD